VPSVGFSGNNAHIPPLAISSHTQSSISRPALITAFRIVSLGSAAHVETSTYPLERWRIFISRDYYVVKTYSACVLSRILKIPHIVCQFSLRVQNTARCVLVTTAPPLHASASVRIYIRIKSCKRTPYVNYQA
jgi:hypothetical protein